MNITTQATAIPLATVVNQPTDSLRRENSQREVILPPTPTQKSAAEKGVASDRERGRTPAQNNEQINFTAIQDKAEKEATTINERNSGDSERRQSNPDENENSYQADSDDSSEHSNPIEAFAHEKQIRQLQNRDREVRSHERAHDAAGGAYTGSPSYSFEIGPDGQKYAVAGEVSVDLSPIEGNPRATIAKMQKVRSAALAPANPSIQDTRVASSAQSIISQAKAQLAQQSRESSRVAGEEGDSDAVTVSRDEIRYTGKNESLRSPANLISSIDASDFDQFINNTIQEQEKISPSRDEKFSLRAQVIESLYANINLAYDKSPRSQFELTA